MSWTTGVRFSTEARNLSSSVVSIPGTGAQQVAYLMAMRLYPRDYSGRGESAIAQAVSRRLPTAAGRVPAQDKMVMGQVFSEYFGFHRLLQNHLSCGAGRISGRSTKWLQVSFTQREKKKRQGREPDHTLPSTAKVKKGGAIPPLRRLSS
jgi:hypothetical protein